MALTRAQRMAVVVAVLTVGACTTSNNPDGGGGTSSGTDPADAGPPPLPRCGGDPCDGVCVADVGRNLTYCAQRCSGAQVCRDAATTCTALAGETICLLPYVAPSSSSQGGSGSGVGSSSSASGVSTASSMGASSSAVALGPADAGPPDSGTPGGQDGGYSPLVWLTGRCQLGRVVVNSEKLCTASFTSVDTAVVESVRLEEVQGTLTLLGGGSVGTVNPGDLYSLGVVAAPSVTGSLSGQLVIRTQGGGITKLPVNGIAASSAVTTVARPVVKADGRVLTAGAAARPNSLIYLDGTASLDDVGMPAADFSWRLIQMPLGAPVTLASQSSAVTRVVPVGGALLSPGDYVAGLRIGNGAGALGAESFVTFHVESNDELVVELTWDGAGTDMDAYLFRGAGLTPAFAPGPDTCTAANCTAAQPGPRWDGSSAPRTGGNPLHLGNVTTGFGPERIVVSAPLAGQYVVGVRYAEDNGQGPNTAAVRVIYRGKVIGSARRGLTRATGSNEWVALQVSLPAGTVTPAPGPAPAFCVPRCNAGQTCTAGACVAASGASPCTTDAQCAPFNACVLGRCLDLQTAPRCVTGCPTGTRCLGENLCVTDAPCSESPGPLQCFGGQCNAINGVCTGASPDACLQNVCEGTLQCLDGTCRECSADTDCGPGTLCDGASGRCAAVGCLRDTDCSGGRVCDTRHGACLSPECSVDTECNAVDTRRQCDAASRRCFLPAAVCTGETDEPNNDVSAARTVGTDPVTGTLCRQDVDYLRIGYQPNRQLRVSVSVTPSTGTQGSGITGELRGRDGRLLAGGTLGADQGTLELSTLTGATAGEAFLILGGFGTAVDQWSYTVTTAQEALPACLTEPGEPNNSVATAANSVRQPGAFSAFLCTSDDVDHHTFQLEASQRIRLRLAFSAAEGGMSLTLLRANGTVVVPTVSSASLPVAVDYATASSPEQLVALVEPFGAPLTVGPRSYTLTSSITYVPNCAEDLFETAGSANNNTQANARVVSPGAFSGVLCDGTDEDWYRVTLPAAGPLEVQVAWPIAEDFADVIIRNSATQVAAATTQNNPESIRLASVPASTYFIQVRPRTPAGAAFRPLAYTVTLVAPSTCSDDAAEGGAGDDVAATARQLRSSTASSFMQTVTGKLCPLDDDWFRLVVADPEQVRVRLTGPMGTVATLLRPDGTTSLGTAPAGGAELVRPVDVPSGELLIKVSAPTAVGTYSLDVVVEPEPNPCAGAGADLEPNGTEGTASTQDIRSLALGGALCPVADEDFFRTSGLVAGDPYVAVVTFDGAAGDLDVQVRNGASVLASDVTAQTGPSTVSVPFSAPASGSVALRLFRKPGGTGTQTYTVRVVPGAFECAGLGSETLANDTAPGHTLDDPAASGAAVGTAFAGAFCPVSDVDWYSAAAQAGFPYRLRVSFDASQGDVDAQALENATLLGQNVSVETGAAQLVLPYVGPAVGTVNFRLSRKAGATRPQTYSVVVEANCAAAPGTEPEPNDTAAQAVAVAAAAVTGGNSQDGVFCLPGDQDHYVITGLPPDTDVELVLAFAGSAGDVDADVVDDLLAPLVSLTANSSAATEERATFRTPMMGAVGVRVFRKPGGANLQDYSLSIAP